MSWFYHLLAASISVTPLILLLLWLAPRLQRRYSARFRSLLWMIITLRLLLPVSLPEKARLAIPIPAETVEMVHLPAISLSPNLDSLDHAGATADPLAILLGVYLLGVAVLLSRESFAYVYFRRGLMRWSQTPPQEMEDLLQELKAELGVQREISLQINRQAATPMVVGLLRPVLLLPADSYPDDELRLIITHELVHLKHHDIGARLLLALASALHWFNPVIHMMAKAARGDMEMACDDQVLKRSGLDTKKRYCNLLLDLAVRPGPTGNSVLSTAIGGSKEILETRIKGIFDINRKRRGIAELTIAAVLVLVGGAALNWNGTEPADSQLSSISAPAPTNMTGAASGAGPNDTILPEMNGDTAGVTPAAPPVTGDAKTNPGLDQQAGGRIPGGIPPQDTPPAFNGRTQSTQGAEVVVVDLTRLASKTGADSQAVPTPADTTER
ncbi:MAG: M56 family metallopeptidase [Syntrophomonadaceae bacterium]